MRKIVVLAYNQVFAAQRVVTDIVKMNPVLQLVRRACILSEAAQYPVTS